MKELFTICFSLLVLIIQTKIIGEGTELAFIAGTFTIGATFSTVIYKMLKEQWLQAEIDKLTEYAKTFV